MFRILAHPTARPYLFLILILIGLGILGGRRVFSVETGYSILQQFATLGPVALALGLSMLIREFDISVAGVLSVAGCLAVLFGEGNPLYGILVAVIAGCCSGLFLGTLIVKLGVSSIGVTLGGLLTLTGVAYVLTGNQEIGYSRLDVAPVLDDPMLGMFSLRSLVALGMFGIAAIVVSLTRVGRDLIATGSNRHAAVIAGVRVNSILIAVFAMSGLLTAIAGSLLSYSLAAASPVGLADTLVPAAAAAIIGGVSLGGGRGHPIGIAGGVLVLCALRSGLTSIGVPPYIHDIVTGAVLIIVGVMDGGDLKRRLADLKRALGHGKPALASHQSGSRID